MGERMDSTPARRRARTAAVLVAAALAAAACGSGDGGSAPTAAAEPPPPSTSTTTGVFLEPILASNAFTYNTALVPPDSTATVTVTVAGSQTVVSLNVSGFVPTRGYGVQAATAPCAADPAAAGPAYQDTPNPASPPGRASTDPHYANAANELWLDFTTTPAGTAYTQRTQAWTFRPGEARSLVFLARHSSTGDDAPGDGGPRVACLDVDF